MNLEEAEKLIEETRFEYCPIKKCDFCGKLFGTDWNAVSRQNRSTWAKRRYCDRKCNGGALQLTAKQYRRKNRPRPLKVKVKRSAHSAIQGYLCESSQWLGTAGLVALPQSDARYYMGLPRIE